MKNYTKVIAGVLAILISAGSTGLYAIAKADNGGENDFASAGWGRGEGKGVKFATVKCSKL